MEASDIVINNPSELIVETSALSAGIYKVKLVTQYSGSGGITLKEPRNGIFDKILT